MAEDAQSSEDEFIGRVRFPKEKEGELFGIVQQLHGSDQLKVYCQDGKERMCRIPGKMRKKVWIRQNDLVVVKVWDFQPSKGDIVWRHMGSQVEWLKRKGYLKNLPI